MKTYYVTFGIQFAHERHPRWPEAHPNGVLAIHADTLDDARTHAVKLLGRDWSDVYSEESWQKYRNYFPRGIIAGVNA